MMCIFSPISWTITILFQEEDEDEDFEEESDDDDTAALLAELEKIKKERAEEQARKVKSKLKC